MSHPNLGPECFTLSSICDYDGSQTVHGIFDSIDAVYYRLKQMNPTCGGEYHIECFHISDAETEAKRWNSVCIERRKYQQKQKETEEKLKEYDLLKYGGDNNDD